MNTFSKKKINGAERVCVRLREARKAAGVSLAKVSERTKLDKRHLEALEECRFDELPEAAVYRKNFIKRYLKAININPKPFVAQFLTEEDKEREHGRRPNQAISRTRFHNLPFVIKYAGITLVVALLLGYLGFQVRNILEPPALAIQSPRNGFVTTDGYITVKGKTNPEVRVSVNGKEITSNSLGEFEQTIDLSPGINELLISAIKKHGKTTSETRYVILKDGLGVSFSNTNHTYE